MTLRTVRRLAWSLWAVVLAGLVGTTSLIVLNGLGEREDLFFDLMAPLMVLGYSTVGALVAARQPRNPIGWLFLAFALVFVVAGFGEAYVARGLIVDSGSLPGVEAVAWINAQSNVGLAVIPLALLLFPAGALPSPRWRPVAWAMVIAPLVAGIGSSVRPGPISGPEGVRILNPIGIEALEGAAELLTTMGAAGSIIAAFGCIAGLVVRFRRSRGEERQQLRWLAYMAAAAGLFLVSLSLLDLVPGGYPDLISNTLFTAFVIVLGLGIPAASGIAILKYRLYDLDIVVNKTVVYLVLAAFITLVYFVMVVGIPVVVFGAGGGALDLLPFAAVAIIALAFQPVRRWASRLANRLVYGRRAEPYELLSEFSDHLAGSYSTDDVLPRMARLIGGGTGATVARVWVRVGDRLRTTASWPVENVAATVGLEGEELPPFPGDERAYPVRHQGELLGAISLTMPRGEASTSSHDKLLGDLASQAGLVLRNVRLIEELRASRQRLVAAQDEERRRLERNIHDGAQQQLVALAVKLRLAENLAGKEAPKVVDLLASLRGETQTALEDLRDLARGIYPPLLVDKGLAAALEAQAGKVPVPVDVAADGIGRYPQEAEAAAYFCVLEALQNVTKYAKASRVIVRLGEEDGDLTFSVSDDGQGFDVEAAPKGSGLQNMADRVEALGGNLEVRSAPGEGTTVIGRIPGGGAA